FFSSRRRHTRLQGDWSSDVCSSDLPARGEGAGEGEEPEGGRPHVRSASAHASASRFASASLSARSPAGRRAASKDAAAQSPSVEIGRASCRERVWIWVVAGPLKQYT